MQLAFRMFGHGGAREGAGRPRSGSGVAHETRPAVSRHTPFHVTLRLAAGLPSLRSRLFPIVVDAVREAQREEGRITDFTVEADHIHLIGEADDNRALAALMRR